MEEAEEELGAKAAMEALYILEWQVVPVEAELVGKILALGIITGLELDSLVLKIRVEEPGAEILLIIVALLVVPESV